MRNVSQMSKLCREQPKCVPHFIVTAYTNIQCHEMKRGRILKDGFGETVNRTFFLPKSRFRRFKRFADTIAAT